MTIFYKFPSKEEYLLLSSDQRSEYMMKYDQETISVSVIGE